MPGRALRDALVAKPGSVTLDLQPPTAGLRFEVFHRGNPYSLEIPSFWKDADRKWMHCALVIQPMGGDGGRRGLAFLRGYRNGAIAGVDYAYLPEVLNYDKCRMGDSTSFGTKVGFEGDLDDVRIYSYPLTEPEVFLQYDKVDEAEMIAHYNFDSGAGTVVYDVSYHGLNGRLASDLAWSKKGVTGACLELDGANDYAKLPPLSFGGAFSASAWVQLASFNVFAKILELGNGPSADAIVIGNIPNSTTLQFTVYVGGQPSTLTAPNLLRMAKGQWLHLACTVSGGGTMRVYANGALVNTLSSGKAPAKLLRRFNYVGRSAKLGSGSFGGRVDEVRLYPYELNSGEVRLLYDRIRDEKLVARYTFESGSGSTVADVSGHGNNGNIVGTTARGTAFSTDAPNGRYSLLLDGSKQYVKLPTMVLGGPMTIMLFVKITPVVGTQWTRIMDFGLGQANSNIAITTVQGSTALGFYILRDQYQRMLYVPRFFDAALGTWMHVTCSVDEKGVFRAYANGVLAGTEINGWMPPKLARNSNYIGRGQRLQAKSSLKGQVDDVRIYPRALSSAEVFDVYDKVQEEEMLGHWRMEGCAPRKGSTACEGVQAHDSSGHGADGKLLNALPRNSWSSDAVQGRYSLDLARACAAGLQASVQLNKPLAFAKGAWSLSAWVKLDDFKGQTSLWSCAPSGSSKAGNVFIGSKKGAADLAFSVGFDGSRNRALVSTKGFWAPAQGRWMHVAFAVTAKAGQLIAWREGKVMGKGIGGIGLPARTARCAIAPRCLGGRVDDVRLYGYLLTTADILRLRDEVEKGDLILRYQFERGSSTTALDSGNHGRNAKLFNMAKSAWSTDAKIGRYALHLDGGDDYVQVPPMTIGGAMSISIWVKYIKIQSWSRIVDFGNGAAKDNILVANVGATDTLQFTVLKGGSDNGGGATLRVAGFWKGAVGQYQHACFTVDRNGAMRAFLGGKLKGVGRRGWAPQAIPRKLNYVGKSNWKVDKSLSAFVDDLRLYDFELSANEVFGLATGGGSRDRSEYFMLLAAGKAATFAQAAAGCKAAGATLASVSSRGDFLRARAACGVGRRCWVGLRRTQARFSGKAADDWAWLDGSALSYQNWGGAKAPGYVAASPTAAAIGPGDGWAPVAPTAKLGALCKRASDCSTTATATVDVSPGSITIDGRAKAQAFRPAVYKNLYLGFCDGTYFDPTCPKGTRAFVLTRWAELAAYRGRKLCSASLSLYQTDAGLNVKNLIAYPLKQAFSASSTYSSAAGSIDLSKPALNFGSGASYALKSGANTLKGDAAFTKLVAGLIDGTGGARGFALGSTAGSHFDSICLPKKGGKCSQPMRLVLQFSK